MLRSVRCCRPLHSLSVMLFVERRSVAKTKISSTDLLWIFPEKLSHLATVSNALRLQLFRGRTVGKWLRLNAIETPSLSSPSGSRKSKQSCELSTGWRGTEGY